MWVECDKNYEPLDVGEVKDIRLERVITKVAYCTVTAAAHGTPQPPYGLFNYGDRHMSLNINTSMCKHTTYLHVPDWKSK